MSFYKLLTSITTFLIMVGCKKEATIINHVEANYSEKHRPQFHFSPQAHWMNDPNGLVYFNGEYHLFYQYYPDSNVWGPMHWGHAVCKNLVQWHHLPIALYPDSLGYIFSGSVVIDSNNTAGFGKNAMVAIFTHHDMDGEKSGTNTFQNQSLAYSLDHGRTFQKYKSNPVIKNPGIKDFRDPKVRWHEESKSWILVLAAYDKVLFYKSSNLIDWKPTGEFGIKGDKRLWECPDLFPVRVDGNEEEKWILITSIQKDAPNSGTATSYFIGDFDGETFKATQNQKWMDYGKDNYAMVTFSNVQDGRTIAMGWMSNWQYAQNVPTTVWRSANTLPREIRLIKSRNDYILTSMPVKEISSMVSAIKRIPTQTISNTLTLDTALSLNKIDLSFKNYTNKKFVIRLANKGDEFIDVGFDSNKKIYYIDRSKSGDNSFNSDFGGIHVAPINYEIGEEVNIQLYLDQSSIELFADDGKTVITEIFFPKYPFSNAKIITESNGLLVTKANIYQLKSIWQ